MLNWLPRAIVAVIFASSSLYIQIFIAGPREARNPNLDSDQRIPYYACAPRL